MGTGDTGRLELVFKKMNTKEAKSPLSKKIGEICLISHRGNTETDSNTYLENTPSYIDLAISLGFNVELDVRTKNGDIYLGHDRPETKIKKSWLTDRQEHLLVHCKDFASLSILIDTSLAVFFHEQEDYTVISNGLIWAHETKNLTENCIIPILGQEISTQLQELDQKIYGVCSDFISLVK